MWSRSRAEMDQQGMARTGIDKIGFWSCRQSQLQVYYSRGVCLWQERRAVHPTLNQQSTNTEPNTQPTHGILHTWAQVATAAAGREDSPQLRLHCWTTVCPRRPGMFDVFYSTPWQEIETWPVGVDHSNSPPLFSRFPSCPPARPCSIHHGWSTWAGSARV